MDYKRLAESISDWMRNMADSAGCSGFVVGLSGGIDSAVTAALAARAMGPGKTLGVLMPCQSMTEDADYAMMLATALDIPTVTVELTKAFETLQRALIAAREGAGTETGDLEMAKANIKPRLRMATLYYLAQSRGYLVAGTGNKPEMMVGYFTKYGDGGVDIEPLGNLYKHEVRALARVLGVPRPIIERPPTAGLWPGQTDEGELGITYDELDTVLDALDRGTQIEYPTETVGRVERMIAASAHKRTMPPAYPVERE